MANPGRRWVLWIVVALLVLVVGGTLWVTRSGGPPPRPTEGEAPVLDQAAIDRAIPPLPKAKQTQMQSSVPLWSAFADRLRGVYAALPAEAKQQMATKGEYVFDLAHLTKEQADVIRDLVEQDGNLRATLEAWNGVPLDLSKVAFAFGRTGSSVSFRVKPDRQGGGYNNWAPIGLWPGGEQGK